MANFETKTIKEIAEGVIAKYKALRQKYNDTTPLLEKAAVRSLSWAFAGSLGSVWQSLVWVYKQCFPQYCDLPVLKLWGGLVDVNYIEGQPAQIELTLYDVTAASLTTGTVYKDLSTGYIYKTTTQGNINNSGNIVVYAQCTTSGTAGNLPVDTELVIANPLDGIPQKATITAIIVEGTEDEQVETYRKRVLIRYKSKAQGGSALDYYNWAMEVPGVVDVLPYVLSEGLVSLYIVGTGSGNQRDITGSLTPNPFPVWVNGNFTELSGSGMMLAVAKSIEGSEDGVHDRRPMCATVQILQPIYTAYSIAITGLSTRDYDTQIKNALIAALDEKRPHIRVLNYKQNAAKINKLALSALVSEIIGDGTFTDFSLKNAAGTEINEESLGIGCLAYMRALTINGSTIEI